MFFQFLAMDDAAEKIKSKGGRLEQPVTLISLGDACKNSGFEIEDLMCECLVWLTRKTEPSKSYIKLAHDFGPSLKGFLDLFSETPIRNLEDLIDFNDKNADLEMPQGKGNSFSTFVQAS